MSKYRMRAAALLAAGAVAGGATAATLSASADDDTSTPSTASGKRPGGPGGPGGHGHGPGVDTAALAEALGVSEDEVEKAVAAVREQLKASSRPTSRPTDAERTEREDAFAQALAEELGVDQDDVTAALAEVRAARAAQRRTDLVERLDEAVADGTLSEDDKASVLKAYDAGVLGGRR
ncbi:hypothetical protein [Nocardioides humi]|uniref:Uncharacterized protein n=1 Tax=Nocardioides humi TaxID=449461 RepID=A0ABN2ASB3_9ACTN|nr:hypothetical protein [Nocardioides humi]